MSFIALPLLLLRRILSAIFALFNALYRLITCRFLRRQNRIGELPFVVTSGEMPKQQQNTTSADWDSWNAESTPAGVVADQIAEYRRQRQAEAAANSAKTKSAQRCQQLPAVMPQERLMAQSDDLFSELQPNVKAPKKLLLRPSKQQQQGGGTKQRNLFAVQPAENGFSIQHIDRLDELGDLDFEQPMNGDGSNWMDDEESIELSQIDAFAREQRRVERARRHAARLAEHAAVRHGKEQLLVPKHNREMAHSNYSNEECRIEM